VLKIIKKAEPLDKEVLPFLISDNDQAHPTIMKRSGMAAGRSALLGFVIMFHSDEVPIPSTGIIFKQIQEHVFPTVRRLHL